MICIPPSGITAQELDAGTLLVTAGSDTLALERFSITRTAEGHTQIVTQTLLPPRRTRVTIDGLLRLEGGQTAFASVENASGPARRVITQFRADRSLIRRFSPRGEAAHEYPPPTRPVVVADSVYAFFAIRPGPGPATFVTPQYSRFRSGAIEEHGVERTTLNGRAVQLERVRLASDGWSIDLWFDGSALQRVDHHAAGITAQRIPAPRR